MYLDVSAVDLHILARGGSDPGSEFVNFETQDRSTVCVDYLLLWRGEYGNNEADRSGDWILSASGLADLQILLL